MSQKYFIKNYSINNLSPHVSIYLHMSLHVSIYLYLSLFISIPPLTAQPLDSLLIIAKTNNLELKILETEHLAALERAPQVSQLPDPEIGIGAFPLPVETRLGPQLVRIGATQTFPWKGVLNGKKEVELAKAKAFFERIEDKELDLSFQLKEAYYQLYETLQSQNILERNLDLLRTLERVALAKVESGSNTMADALRVQLKIQELNQEIKILETSKTKPITIINQLLNRALDSPISIPDSLPFATLPFDRNTLLREIGSRHPRLRMFELQQDVSRKAITANELEGKPTLGLGLDYIMVNNRSDATPTNNGRDIVQLRASIKLPLYRQKYTAREREEQLKIQALNHKKSETLNQFMTAIEEAYADYEAAQLKMELYQQQTTIIRAAINILKESYTTQGKGFDELLNLEKDLIDYDLKILKAIVESHRAKIGIERFLISR